MSKRTIYLLGILATLIIGFFLHWYFCCNDNCTKDTMTGETSQGNTLAPLPFKFEDGDITIRSNDNFNFMSSNHTIVQPLSEDLLSRMAYEGKWGKLLKWQKELDGGR